MITFKAKTDSGEIIKSALSHFIFPAGEPSVTKEPKRDLESTEIAIIQPSPDSLHDDLFKLAMWEDYITRTFPINGTNGPTPKLVVVIPYFPGARADRGAPFGASVYAMFFYKMMIDQIILFDPHSSVVVEELEYLMGKDAVTVVNSDELLGQPALGPYMDVYDYIIAPDKGATERAGAVADALGIPCLTAEKTRDFETGKLSGFSIDLPESDKDWPIYLIVDDICDGGGTFLGLFDAMDLEYGQVDLFVSHGVLSKDAITNLTEKFENVFTTNSYNPQRKLVLPGMETEQDYISLQYSPFTRLDVIHLLLSKVK